LIQTSNAINVMEESIFKRVFNNNMQEAENVLGDSALLSEFEIADERAGEPLSSRISTAVMIFPQAEPEFNNLGSSASVLNDSNPLKSPAWNISDVIAEQYDDAMSQKDNAEVAIDKHQRHSFALQAGQLQEEKLENYNHVSAGHFQHLLSQCQSKTSLVEHQRNTVLNNNTQFTQVINSPSSSDHAQVLPIEHPLSANNLHDHSSEQYPLELNIHISPPLSVHVGDSAVVSAPARTSGSHGLLKPALSDVEPSFTVVKNRTGPKTPISPPLSVQVGDSAVVSAPARTSGSHGLLKPALSDVEPGSAVSENRNEPKASVAPFHTDLDITFESRLVHDESLADVAYSAVTSVPQQQFEFFKIGPKTPSTPAAPTRHVRQWLVHRDDEARPQNIETNRLFKLPEQLFIRRSIKPPNSFLEHPLQSFMDLSASEQFSITASPLLQANSSVSDQNPDTFSTEGEVLIRPSFSWSDASTSGKQRLARDVAHSTSASSTSNQRLPQGSRNFPAAQSVSSLSSKHADKSDALSFHRAEMFRELDAALRIQWPQSFQKIAQVCSWCPAPSIKLWLLFVFPKTFAG
jgi:hypothetical protein